MVEIRSLDWNTSSHTAAPRIRAIQIGMVRVKMLSALARVVQGRLVDFESYSIPHLRRGSPFGRG